MEEHRITFTPVKITALALGLMIALLAGGAAWKLFAMFEAVITRADSGNVAATFSAGETALVALMAATLGVGISGLVAITMTVLSDPPPPAYPAGPMNAFMGQLLPFINRRDERENEG